MRIGCASGSMPAAAVAAKHVRQRDLGVRLRDPGRVEVDGGAAVLRLDALALVHLVEDRLRDDVARAERVGELLAVRVQEHGAVGARRLRDRVALHRLRPRAAVRVVLERVEVARLGAEVERDRVTSPVAFGWFVESSPRSSASLKQRPPAARTTVAASTHVLAAVRAPAVLARLERRAAGCSGASCRRPPRTPRAGAFVIAWPVRSPTWSRRFARRAAAAGEAVAAVLARERDAELLEPVDRGRRLARERPRRGAGRRSRASSSRRPAACCSGESSSPKAAWMPPCALAELQAWSEPFVASADAGAGALGRDRGGQAGGAAADHEHVE